MDTVTEMSTDRPAIPILDQITAANMADTLHKHYPNYRWAVFVSSEQGIAKVYNLDLTGQHAWVLHLDVMFSATDWDRRIMRAGGEILERYGSRAAASIWTAGWRCRPTSPGGS